MRHQSAPRRALGAISLSVLFGASSVLAGCTAGHTVLGTPSSPCFRSIPAAAGAVHRQGQLLGVRRLPAEKVAPPHRLARLPALRMMGREAVCAIAYRGEFSRSQVEHGTGRPHGPIAVVVLRPSDSEVIVTFVLRALPLRFRHL